MYYIDKFRDTDKPKVQYGEYLRETYSDFYSNKENLHFYFLPKNTRTGKPILWDTFWKNFSLFGSTLHVDHSHSIVNTWNDINFRPCKDIPWVKKMPEGHKKMELY